MSKKALLLGAGFSYDLGMPIAKGLTQDLFYFLTPERIEKYINIWKTDEPFGKDRPISREAMDEVLDIYQKYYNNVGSNYEEFLKEIQDRYNELGVSQDKRDALYYVFGKFFDIICEMFIMYQINNLGIYMNNKKFYEGFNDFVSDDELWIISLNHDLFIEFLCFDNDIPLSLGSIDNIALPKSNIDMKVKDCIKFGRISRDNMQINKMNFIKGNRGVNLIKLHGAINEFTYDDDKYILHIKPEKDETTSSYLNKLNKVWLEMCYYVNGIPVKLGSEIAVSDLQGKMQFLRKSILTGGYKYSETFDPKPGEEKIKLMEEVLSNVDDLTIIGYGFNDKHINLRIYNAMLLNKYLKVCVVDPFKNRIPDILKPFDYKMRVRGATCGTPEWFSYIKKKKWDMKQLEELKKVRKIRQTLDEQYRKKFL